MSATIPSLWPEDIKVDVLPPLTILRLQAAKLHEITKGILRGEVTTVTGSDDFVSHSLDLIAPALDNRRHRVLIATHRAEFYPAVIEADCFRPKTKAVSMKSMISLRVTQLELQSEIAGYHEPKAAAIASICATNTGRESAEFTIADAV